MAQHPNPNEFDDAPIGSDEPLEEATDEEEADEGAPPAPPKKGGRPRDTSTDKKSWSAVAVFKDQEEFQQFLDEAAERQLSTSAYALAVLKNRHNTQEGIADFTEQLRRKEARILQLEGAREVLQGMYDTLQEKRSAQPGGLSGLDNQPVTGKELQKLIAEGIAKRDEQQRLASIPGLEKKIAELTQQLEELQDEYDELEDELVKNSDIESKVKTYGPPVAQLLAKRFPNVVQQLGELAGLTSDELGIAGGFTPQVSDSLVTAALHTRENIPPRQVRDLEFLLDSVARKPGYLDRFVEAIRAAEVAQPQPANQPLV